jgi:multiple sugar transport system ATP-binding protein
MASVAIRDVRKAFGATTVIHGVDVPSATASSSCWSVPRAAASRPAAHDRGLENITSGEIRIGERVVNNLPPKERDVAMVFQNYALYPHMTVAANMGFSMRLRGAPKSENRRAGAARRRDSRPRPRISSGFRGSSPAASASASPWAAPSCAIRRCFCSTSRLSNLDAKLRVQMRTEIKELHQRLKTTTIYVTHDQIEA